MDFELSEADMEKLNKTGINQRLSPLEAYVIIWTALGSFWMGFSVFFHTRLVIFLDLRNILNIHLPMNTRSSITALLSTWLCALIKLLLFFSHFLWMVNVSNATSRFDSCPVICDHCVWCNAMCVGHLIWCSGTRVDVWNLWFIVDWIHFYILHHRTWCGYTSCFPCVYRKIIAPRLNILVGKFVELLHIAGGDWGGGEMPSW